MSSSSPRQIVFLLEEPSAEKLLNCLIPRVLPDVNFVCIPHEGKNDLHKSIPRKLKGWRNPAYFVILHDQDANNCMQLKTELRKLCRDGHRPDSLIRIACRELESWYWGDLQAVAKIYPKFNPKKWQNRAQFRNPDSINRPAETLRKKIPEFQKGFAAREIGRHMDWDGNTSPSFRHFIGGVRRAAESITP